MCFQNFDHQKSIIQVQRKSENQSFQSQKNLNPRLKLLVLIQIIRGFFLSFSTYHFKKYPELNLQLTVLKSHIIVAVENSKKDVPEKTKKDGELPGSDIKKEAVSTNNSSNVDSKLEKLD